MRRLLAAILAALAGGISAASAGYIDQYKKYDAAMKAGDLKDAIEASEAAWNDAEAELGENRLTAILAYNYGLLIYDYAPPKAAAAFARSRDLVARGVADLSPLEIDLALAASQFASRGGDGADRKALEAAISAAEFGKTAPTFFLAEAWKLIAQDDFIRDRNAGALKAAEKAIEYGKLLSPAPNRLFAVAYTIGGITTLLKEPRTNATIVRAAEHLDRAIVLFEPQKSIDEFHPLFAKAMVWRASINALAETENQTKALGKIDKNLDADALCRWQIARPPHCTVEWDKRTPPRYPSRGLKNGSVGAVLVGYDLSETGVERAVLIGGVNGEEFAEAALQSTKNWTLKSAPPPECRKNHVIVFSFVIR